MSLCRLRIGLLIAWGLKKKMVFICLLEAVRLDFYVANVGDGFDFVYYVGCDFLVENVD